MLRSMLRNGKPSQKPLQPARFGDNQGPANSISWSTLKPGLAMSSYSARCQLGVERNAPHVAFDSGLIDRDGFLLVQEASTGSLTGHCHFRAE